jgi:hypothetical protein
MSFTHMATKSMPIVSCCRTRRRRKTRRRTRKRWRRRGKLDLKTLGALSKHTVLLETAFAPDVRSRHEKRSSNSIGKEERGGREEKRQCTGI